MWSMFPSAKGDKNTGAGTSTPPEKGLVCYSLGCCCTAVQTTGLVLRLLGGELALVRGDVGVVDLLYVVSIIVGRCLLAVFFPLGPCSSPLD